MATSKIVLPIIVVSQFCCTSLWFAGNGVMGDLVTQFNFNSSALGHLTSAVQFGFITGTLIFAILTIADRFSPSKVFMVCALLGATANAGVIWEGHQIGSMLLLRFMTGFFLAGIYPVGMKIAADYFDKGLGKSLGLLVGALVLGTAFPHLLKSFAGLISWKVVLLCTSLLAVIGGGLMALLVPDGPFRKPGLKTDFSAFWSVFKDQKFRGPAFGYFGHMWELYAFWTFVPTILISYNNLHSNSSFNIPLLSFIIIGVGGLACAISGLLSEKLGTKKTAFTALTLSGVCCLLAPFMFQLKSPTFFIAFLIFWGMVVVADSPLFSTLVAKSAPAHIKGTALTIVNCIGFTITILSIQLLNFIQTSTDSHSIYALLAIGPVLGLVALRE